MKRELLSIVLLTNILMYGFAQSVINYKVEKAENDQLLLCKINDIVYKIDIEKPSEDGYKTWVIGGTEEKLDNKSVEILPSFNFIYEDEFNSIEGKALVDSIGEYAFANTGIICISLPPTIKKIGSGAFMGTNQLKGIKIPEGVEKIYGYCFIRSGIEKIYLYANTILDRFIFYGCESLKTIYIQVVDDIAFPVKWELFDKQAFWKGDYDTNERFTIKVEDTTKYYENVEKEENSPWKYVKIEHWETTDKDDIKCEINKNSNEAIVIGDNNYYSKDTPKIKKRITQSDIDIKIPANLTYDGNIYNVTIIGDYAFICNLAISSITLPSTIKKINTAAFANCNELTDFYCYTPQIPETESNAFVFSNIDKATLYVPEELIEAYKNTEPWNGFGEIKGLGSASVKNISEPTDNNSVWYNIQGVRLMVKPTTPGLYINNGKKIVIN